MLCAYKCSYLFEHVMLYVCASHIDDAKTESATAIRTAKKKQQLDPSNNSAIKDASGM